LGVRVKHAVKYTWAMVINMRRKTKGT
jgi:hypothetical protein